MTPELEKKLKYGTKFHERILSAVRERYDLSCHRNSDRQEQWRKDEETFLAYMPENELDALRRNKRETEGIPQQTTIVIPYSYAIAMTMHTYLTSVFLSRDPIFQFEGSDGKADQARPAVESLIAYQMTRGMNVAKLYLYLMDLCKYGVACGGVYWDEERHQVRRTVEEPMTFLGIPVAGRTKKVHQVEEVVGYVGNKLYNVRPYNTYTDPRRSLSDYQEGEFLITESDDFAILDLQTGDFINKEVAVKMRRRGVRSPEGSEEQEMPDVDLETSLPLDVTNVGTGNMKDMHIRLIPSEWGLGDGDRVEKWTITVWNDAVVVQCMPRGEYHNKFPTFIETYEIDAYQSATRSVSEILRPMQDLLNWLINTHMYNVRKNLNGQWVVDPSLIRMNDFNNPEPGKALRLRPQAYGAGKLDQAVMQLPVADTTQTHVNDLALIAQMMQRASGVTDQVMGMMMQGGRRTAQEVRTNTAFGVNRLKTVSEWGSAHAWDPLARMLLQNTQQFLDTDLSLRIVGDNVNLRGARRFIDVSPEDISGSFDFVPVDGTLPIDRYAQANLWREMLATAGAVPGVLAQYDMGGIFAWVAQLAGLKSIKQFRLQVADDEILRQQLAAGNVVDFNSARGDVGGGVEAGTEFTSAGPAGDEGLGDSGQVSGLGPLG